MEGQNQIANGSVPGSISIRALAVGYGDGQNVIQGLNLEVKAGETFVLIGPNGCGKTTLLISLAGQLPFLSGEVILDGKGLAQYTANQLALKRSLVLTERAGTGQMTVRELLTLGRYPHTGWLGKIGPEDMAEIERAVLHFSLASFIDKPLYQLSDGMRQRASLARAWVQACPLMLLDEPTHHLDLSAKAEIFHLLKAYSGTMLIATHELELAMRIADRMLLMDGKGGFEIGTPVDLTESGAISRCYDNSFVRFDQERRGFIFNL